jgi:hypothetical protein
MVYVLTGNQDKPILKGNKIFYRFNCVHYSGIVINIQYRLVKEFLSPTRRLAYLSKRYWINMIKFEP